MLFVDTNSIPVIAVKRVEVLKEGAASNTKLPKLMKKGQI